MSLADTRRFAAIGKFEALHRRDPKTVVVEGTKLPWSLHYHRRLSHWVSQLAPNASEALQLAAHCQHLCRWKIPREQYPQGLVGYKRWRRDLAKFHAQEAGKILAEVGYDQGMLDRVGQLLTKKRFKQDAEVQLFEDAICLVFLENEFADFSQKHDQQKMLNILNKTWKKMSEQGHRAALSLLDQLPTSPILDAFRKDVSSGEG